MQKITVEIMGGLGNQLFQIFTLLSYCIENKKVFYFEDKPIACGHRKIYYWKNILSGLDKFIKQNNSNISIYREPHFHYKSIPNFDNENIKLFGYFQSYKYFDKNINQITKLIKLKEKQNELKNKLQQNIDLFSKTVSLHFRVGDYVNLQNHHPLMKVEYYTNAIKHLITETEIDDWNILYFCEENDIEYVENKVNILRQQFTNMSFQRIHIKLEDWEEMLTMSLCEHNIIANSSFSWWGAYFNNNENKKVYYPDIWFGPAQGNKNMNDLFPKNWTKI